MQIKIKGQPYSVKIDSEIIDDKLGSCNVKDKILRVTKERDQPLDTMQTIIHELTHAHLYECGSPLFGDEDITFWLETQFFSILRCFIEITCYIYPKERDSLKKAYERIDIVTRHGERILTKSNTQTKRRS